VLCLALLLDDAGLLQDLQKHSAEQKPEASYELSYKKVLRVLFCARNLRGLAPGFASTQQRAEAPSATQYLYFSLLWLLRDLFCASRFS
jgi:hypothetical protein